VWKTSPISRQLPTPTPTRPSPAVNTSHTSTMEATFNERPTTRPQETDEQRRQENASREERGEKTIGGSAGREQISNKDPAEFDARGGPGGDPKPKQSPVM